MEMRALITYENIMAGKKICYKVNCENCVKVALTIASQYVFYFTTIYWIFDNNLVITTLIDTLSITINIYLW